MSGCSFDYTPIENTFTGPTGATGARGLAGGWSIISEWDSSTASSPGTGETRFNNATLASVTQLFISDTDDNGVDISAVLDAYDNGGDFGLIRVFKESDSSVFWMGTVTAEADSGTYHTVTVTHTASNGTFTDADKVWISFAPAGADGAAGSAGSTGATGAAGTDGTTVEFFEGTTDSLTGAGYANFANKVFTITAATYDTAGDTLDMEFHFTQNTGTTSPVYVDIHVDGNSICSGKITEFVMPDRNQCMIKVRLTYLTNTTAFVAAEQYIWNTGNYSAQPVAMFYNSVSITSYSGSNFNVEVKGKTDGTKSVSCVYGIGKNNLA